MGEKTKKIDASAKPARKASYRWISFIGIFLVALLYASYVIVYEEYTWRITQMIDRDPCSSSCGKYQSEIPLYFDGQKPSVYVVGSDNYINPGQCVCIRAVLPPVAGNSTLQGGHYYRPIPMYPADSLLVDLVMYESKDEMDSDDPLYKDSRVTVSVDVRPITDDRNPDLARVYQGTVRLYDPGFYKLDATLEHRDSQWNAEPGQKSVGLIGMNLDTEGSVSVIRDLKHPTYLGNHQKLPLCTSADEPGRWIPADNLPKHWKAWQYVSPVEDGRVWLPYHCRLRRISHAEFTHKMSQKYDSVHWYGDSNSRRSIRPFITAGKWCNEKDSLKRLDCLCNDAPKDLFPDDWYPSRPQPHWYRIHTNGVNGSEVFEDLRKLPLNPTDDKPIPEDDLEAVDDDAYGYGFTPKAYSQRNDYFDLYYLFTRGTRDMYGSYWARDITAQNIAAYRKPSLVIVQMITWDVAFGSYESFIKELPPLIKRLQKVYPNTQFIYRSGPYWCCKDSEDEEKKYSRLRFMAFDHQARRLFKKHLKAGVWDVIKAPSSRPPEVKRLKENLPCLSAHTRAELIHLDNQLLMNMLVNGN